VGRRRRARRTAQRNNKVLTMDRAGPWTLLPVGYRMEVNRYLKAWFDVTRQVGPTRHAASDRYAKRLESVLCPSMGCQDREYWYCKLLYTDFYVAAG
jgi:hypothetical protein